MSEHRQFNNDPDTKMSAYAFNDECDEAGSDEEDDNVVDFDEEEFRKALSRLIITNDLPFEIVECPSFQEFTLTLNPHVNFEAADVETVELMIDDRLNFYEEEKAKIKEILKTLDTQISLSVDIVRSPDHEFMCLTAHFIDDTWKVKKWVLRFYVLCNDLPEALKKFLCYWGIEDKISTITLKSGSYIDKTVEMVKDRIQKKKKFQLNGQLFRVYCCADLFNLMVQDAFDELSTMDKVCQLIIWVKSPLWYVTASRLKELHAKGEFSSEHVGDSELPSQYNYEVPSVDEWEKVEGICKLVEVIHSVAKLLFETKYPTASIFLGNLQELRARLTREDSTSDSFIKAVVEKMVRKLDKYWEDMFLVLAIAAVMDPRCKMKFIEFLSSKINGSDINSQVSTVLEAIHSLCDDYPTCFIPKEDLTSSHSEEKASDPEYEDLPSKKGKEDEVPSGLEEECTTPNNSISHSEGYRQFVQSISPPSKSELEWYLEEPVLPWNHDFNLLNWWRALGPKYPRLSRMARDLLSIPFSVVTSSAAYLTEERKIDPELVSSGQDVLNAFICASSWPRKQE